MNLLVRLVLGHRVTDEDNAAIFAEGCFEYTFQLNTVGHGLLQIKNPALWPGLEMKRPNLERLGHDGEILTLGD